MYIYIYIYINLYIIGSVAMGVRLLEMLVGYVYSRLVHVVVMRNYESIFSYPEGCEFWGP